MYKFDKRIVMTLDAGGTNFVFTAMQANEEIVSPVCLPSNADNLAKCLGVLVEGFTKVKEALSENPVAISFAFPGPADYANGVIGDLPNLKAFRGGVALGPFLEYKFGIASQSPAWQKIKPLLFSLSPEEGSLHGRNLYRRHQQRHPE